MNAGLYASPGLKARTPKFPTELPQVMPSDPPVLVWPAPKVEPLLPGLLPRPLVVTPSASKAAVGPIVLGLIWLEPEFDHPVKSLCVVYSDVSADATPAPSMKIVANASFPLLIAILPASALSVSPLSLDNDCFLTLRTMQLIVSKVHGQFTAQFLRRKLVVNVVVLPLEIVLIWNEPTWPSQNRKFAELFRPCR